MNEPQRRGLDEIDAIVEQLSNASETLNDLAMDLVRGAIEDGEGDRPELEKRVSKARRTVDRAIAQLRGALTSD